jgi:predicted transcriptional regulator
MTKLLDQAIDKLRSLPEDEQEVAAEAMLIFADRDRPRYRPTPQQLAEIEDGLAQADRGEFASDEEMEAFWHERGL